MRNGQNKRMRGRNRRGHNPLTRVYESNGPDVKIRGTAHHIAEKYLQLARDAQSSGDPIAAEGYHQHAEHYFRLIAAAQQQFAQQNPHQQHHQQPFVRSDMNQADDFEDEGDGAPEQQPGVPQPQQGGAPNMHMQRPQPQHHQPQPNFQPYPQGREQPEQRDVGLPAFITGGQGGPQPSGGNGFDNEHHSDRDGGRFHRRGRRFRHRGPRDFEQRGDFGGQQAGQAEPAQNPVDRQPGSDVPRDGE